MVERDHITWLVDLFTDCAQYIAYIQTEHISIRTGHRRDVTGTRYIKELAEMTEISKLKIIVRVRRCSLST